MHFSGYHVILDFDGEQGFDPSCLGGDAFLQAGRAAGHIRTSGYITTTGFDETDHEWPPSRSSKCLNDSVLRFR